jgi:hypothetical protein
MLAGIQAAALLIAAKRSDSLSSEIAIQTAVSRDHCNDLVSRQRFVATTRRL